jgi:N12 class adenine-specific DNA methylase
MLFAIRTIQERSGKDLGATFLSGTTISNSLTELYLLFKYLRPQALERQGINSFDAWAAVFAKKSTDYEFSITNEIIQKERFRTFIKVTELASFYAEICDFSTANDIVSIAPEKRDTASTYRQRRSKRVIGKLMEFARRAMHTLGTCAAQRERRKGKDAHRHRLRPKDELGFSMIDWRGYSDHIDNKASPCAKVAQ